MLLVERLLRRTRRSTRTSFYGLPHLQHCHPPWDIPELAEAGGTEQMDVFLGLWTTRLGHVLDRRQFHLK